MKKVTKLFALSLTVVFILSGLAFTVNRKNERLGMGIVISVRSVVNSSQLYLIFSNKSG